MPDATRPHTDAAAPRDWHDAFAALPLERPEANAWSDIARRLPTKRRRARWPALLAIAAAAVLAVVVPMRLMGPTPTEAASTAKPAAVAVAPATQAATPIDPLEQLYAQSAQFEALLAIARDDRVSSGAAVEVAAGLDTELARIDAQLREPGLSHERQLALWRARVDVLGSLVGFEGTRRWLAVHGQRYDGALVRAD